jgi:hypothetical protein
MYLWGKLVFPDLKGSWKLKLTKKNSVWKKRAKFFILDDFTAWAS